MNGIQQGWLTITRSTGTTTEVGRKALWSDNPAVPADVGEVHGERVKATPVVPALLAVEGVPLVPPMLLVPGVDYDERLKVGLGGHRTVVHTPVTVFAADLQPVVGLRMVEPLLHSPFHLKLDPASFYCRRLASDSVAQGHEVVVGVA